MGVSGLSFLTSFGGVSSVVTFFLRRGGFLRRVNFNPVNLCDSFQLDPRWDVGAVENSVCCFGIDVESSRIHGSKYLSGSIPDRGDLQIA